MRDRFLDTKLGRRFLELEAARKRASSGQEEHGLPSKLIVNVTSHQPRFATLHLTLTSIINQDVRPDRILLWIARDDFEYIPAKTLSLQKWIDIRPCDDLRSYKKLVPALKEHAACFNVTADDDVYYKSDWLRQLVEPAAAGAKAIAYHFGFVPTFEGNLIASYAFWLPDIAIPLGHPAIHTSLPVGVGGILYPPGSLHPDVTDRGLFERLAPDSDDLWFYAMTRLNGFARQRVGTGFEEIQWPGTQVAALWTQSAPSRNDLSAQAISHHYGIELFPEAAMHPINRHVKAV